MRLIALIALIANAGTVLLGLYLYLYHGLLYGGTAPLMAAAFFGLPALNILALFGQGQGQEQAKPSGSRGR